MFNRVGAGISNDGILIVTDSIIERQRASGAGGAVANRGALTVLRTIIRANFGSAGTPAGGIINSGTATIMNSSITQNNSQGGTGGIANGDAISGVVGSMTIHNSTISDNGSDNIGGIQNHGVMIITNSTGCEYPKRG